MIFSGFTAAQASLCPGLFSERAFNFSFSKEQLLTAQAQVNRELIDESYFLIPANDGEAVRAAQILEAVKAPHLLVSHERWGVTLDKINLDSKILQQVKRVVIFEIPGVEIEDKLRAQGLEVIVIDHHAYKNLDRRKPESSIEQLMQLIHWPMSRVDKAIAVNDRGYVPGLKAMGLSPTEIREIRKFDLKSQGRSPSKIDEQTRLAQELIPQLNTKQGEIYILDFNTLPPIDEGILKQELAIQSPTGIVSSLTIKSDSIGFSGNPRIAQRLLALNFESLGYPEGSFAQYGGGDPNASMFFGFKPTQPPKGEPHSLIPKHLVEKIFQEIQKILNDTPTP